MRRPNYNLPHLDAAANVYFSRQLELIDPRLYARIYAERKARQFVPTGDLIPDGIETYTFRSTDKVGQAKRISNAADDLPQSNMVGTEDSARLWDYGAAYSYTQAEIVAASRAGLNLDAQRADAAREMLAQKLDDLISQGDADVGTKGLLNLTGPSDVTGTLTGGWGTASADEIIADFKLIVNKAPSVTKDVEKPTAVIMPTLLLRQIESMPRSTLSDTTVLEFLKKNFPAISFLDWERANGAGASSKNRIVAYTPTVEKLRQLMSVEVEALAPQVKNFSYLVNMRMRAGGIVLYKPLSVTYGDVAL